MKILNKIEFLHNKILSKEYFSKFFIRSSKIDNKNIYILDNSYLQLNINHSDLNRFIFSKNSKLGYSLKVDVYNFKNIFNDIITFKSYFLSQNFINNTSFTQSFIKSLTILYNENIKNILFLTSPTKGGFCCYCYGFKGFIPKKHCNFFLLEFLEKFKVFAKKKNIIFYLNYIIKFKNKNSFLNIYSRYFILDIKFFKNKIQFVKNFKSTNNNLNKKFNLNFIFFLGKLK